MFAKLLPAAVSLPLLLFSAILKADETPRITLAQPAARGKLSHESFPEWILKIRKRGDLEEVKLPSGDHRFGIQMSFEHDPKERRSYRKDSLKVRAYCSVGISSEIADPSGNTLFDMTRTQQFSKAIPSEWAFSLSTPDYKNTNPIKEWEDVRGDSVIAELPYTVEQLRGKLVHLYCRYSNHHHAVVRARSLTIDGRTIEGTEQKLHIPGSRDATLGLSTERDFTFVYFE